MIGPIPASCGGIRVDLAGNIYLGLRLWPKGSPLPEELAKNQAYATWTGSIVKFGPKGGTVIGAVKEDDSPDAKKGLDTEQWMTVTGALAIYPGIAPFSGNGYGGAGGSTNSMGNPNQFGCGCATPDVAAGNPLVGTGGSRDIQLGLKFTF